MAKKYNKEKEIKDLTKERDLELIPVARGILRIISEADLALGNLHAHDNSKYDAAAKQILELLLKYNVKYVDKDYVFQLVLQPFEIVREVVSKSLSVSFDRSLERSFGKEFRQVTLGDLDKVLKKS